MRSITTREQLELYIANYLKTKERNSRIKTPAGSKLANIESMIEMDRDNMTEKAKDVEIDEDEKQEMIEDAIKQIRAYYSTNE